MQTGFIGGIFFPLYVLLVGAHIFFFRLLQPCITGMGSFAIESVSQSLYTD